MKRRRKIYRKILELKSKLVGRNLIGKSLKYRNRRRKANAKARQARRQNMD